MWVIFALPDPDSESGSGSTDLIESGSNPDPYTDVLYKIFISSKIPYGITLPVLPKIGSCTIIEDFLNAGISCLVSQTALTYFYLARNLVCKKMLSVTKSTYIPRVPQVEKKLSTS